MQSVRLEEFVVSAISSFVDMLSTTGASNQTIKSYSTDVVHFLNWLTNNNLTIKQVDKELAGRYLEELKNHYKPNTVRRKCLVLRRFFDFLEDTR